MLILSNGPLVTNPGVGYGGADASAVQSGLLMTTYGLGFQLTAGNRLADDFTVPSGQTWQVTSFRFFGYQTYSTLASTFTSLNLQIWEGVPGAAGSAVIWGDESTDRLTSTSFSGIYRTLEEDMANQDRPIMFLDADVSVNLSAGTYWLDWQADGDSGLSGPWGPPVSILGSTTTGDALQYTTTSGSWDPVLDGGTYTAQGMPFEIRGVPEPNAAAWTAAVGLCALAAGRRLRLWQLQRLAAAPPAASTSASAPRFPA